MPTELVNSVMWFRLVERGTLTIAVLLACAWLIRKYNSDKTHLSVSAGTSTVSQISLTIGTPILIALLFVGYTFIIYQIQLRSIY